MRQPERPDDADNPLRLCYTGPSPTRGANWRSRTRFGLELICGYGLSETPLRPHLAPRAPGRTARWAPSASTPSSAT